jgi:cell division septation protein DedD
MSPDLEADLTRILNAAADRAPQPEPGLLSAVADRRVHRRRTRLAGTAAVAALVAGTLAIPVAGALIGSARQHVAQPSTTTIDLGTARPAEEIWPAAVVRLPTHLPDGRSLNVVQSLDADRFVVTPAGGPDIYSFPAIYNARTHQLTELMIGTAPAGVNEFGYGGIGTISYGQITWVATGRGVDNPARHGYYEVWSAPIAGGPSVRRAVFDLPGEIAIVSPFRTGTALYASVVNLIVPEKSRIYRLPEGGGQPQLVAGSEGYAAAFGSPPWASIKERVRIEAVPPSPSPGVSQGFKVDTNARRPATYWNVETGERRTPRSLAGVTDPQCTPEICIGEKDDDIVVYRFDGSRITYLTGWPTDGPSTMPDYNISTSDSSGRFVLSRKQSSAFLADLTTHTAATLPPGFLDASIHGGQIIVLHRTDAEQVLLDLSRIT